MLSGIIELIAVLVCQDAKPAAQTQTDAGKREQARVFESRLDWTDLANGCFVHGDELTGPQNSGNSVDVATSLFYLANTFHYSLLLLLLLLPSARSIGLPKTSRQQTTTDNIVTLLMAPVVSGRTRSVCYRLGHTVPALGTVHVLTMSNHST